MGSYVAERVIKLMIAKRTHIYDSRILVMGLAFKENCPDTRNTRVVDIISTLQSYHAKVDVFDPWVDADASELLVQQPNANSYDAIVIAVAHDQFLQLGLESIRKFGKDNAVIFDVKHLFDSKEVDGGL